MTEFRHINVKSEDRERLVELAREKLGYGLVPGIEQMTDDEVLQTVDRLIGVMIEWGRKFVPVVRQMEQAFVRFGAQVHDSLQATPAGRAMLAQAARDVQERDRA